MSSSPAFKTVIFFDQEGIKIYVQEKKEWRALGETLQLDSLPGKDLQAELKDGNVLAVVSDEFCGHLQIEVPNKKEQYSDEKIGEVLQKEHQIDLESYEFASQRFPLGREEVQVSISGIEKEIYGRIESWITALGVKKFWLVPFGWFVSSLKSVEPALIAVAPSEDRVFVSHHYLGVDDARVIALKDLKDYAVARREERKETHLLYIQSTAELRRQATKLVGDEAAVHPLLPEESDDALGAVVGAVMAKGSDTLGELLHFVGEDRPSEAAAKVEKPVKKVSAAEKMDDTIEAEPVEDLEKPTEPEKPEMTVPEAEAPSAEDLPKPVPPAPVEEVMVEAPKSTETNARTVVEVEEEPAVEVSAPPQPIPVVSPEEPPLISQLHPSSAVNSNTDRYLDMPDRHASWKAPLLVFIAVALITGIVGGAVLWSRQVWSPGPPLLPEASLVTPSPEPTPEATPEPATASAVITEAEKKQTKIIVLNATGIAGLAGKVKTKLAESGWTQVQTGNAEGSYDGATFVSTEKTELIPVLSEELGVELKPAPQVKESQADGYTIVIILAERISLE